jgi:hypothetical protein
MALNPCRFATPTHSLRSWGLRLLPVLFGAFWLALAAEAAAAPRIERVLIVGDSAIQAGLGTALERGLKQDKQAVVLRFAQQSTGLCRPDRFDWNKKLADLKEQFHPQLTIAEWGNNDNQAVFSSDGRLVAKFGTPEWDKVYAARVTAAVKLLSQDGGAVVLLGLPNMRDRQTAHKAEHINKVVEAAVTGAGGTFLSTWEMTSAADGKYLAAIEWEGKTRAMREGDGVHLSAHGAAYVVSKLLVKLDKLFAFPG